MPINLETINAFYKVNLKPYEVENFLAQEIAKEPQGEPTNFEEMAISQMGRPLYEAFIRGYTMKQWQTDPKTMPMSVLKRLPFRKNYDENYYNSIWQGIPTDGYTKIFERMLDNPLITLQLGVDFFDIKQEIPTDVQVVYSGPIDKFFGYCYGMLDWRTLRFEIETHPVDDMQGAAVMNYAEEAVPYTRIHEPKHLHPERKDLFEQTKTLTIKEYSLKDDGTDPYYPINDAKNQELILKYRAKADALTNFIIAGRLGDYRYYDMHDTIARALQVYDEQIKNRG